MRLLILGGTSFVGRAIVEDALANGHEVTLFNRGKTRTELFGPLPRLIGDRDAGDYEALRGGEWDAAVDVSGYVPRHVGQAMDVLNDNVGRYLFISSHAVYDPTAAPGADERAPLREPCRDTESLDNSTYGRLKVACELDVTAHYGTRATIVRPGKVAGPHDNSDMFTYWVRRAAQGGRVALPGAANQPCQLVDSRDLARLVTCLLADNRSGAFHAVGPAEATTLGGLIETCAHAAGTEVEIVQVAEDYGHRFFPLARPREIWSTLKRDPAKARAAGMPATPLQTTAADVAAWDRSRGLPPLQVGFSAATEAQLLANIHG